MARRRLDRKIQTLLIEHLRENGDITLLLPDGVTLEISVAREEGGRSRITEDYCRVSAERDHEAVTLDTYEVSMEYDDGERVLVELHEPRGDGAPDRHYYGAV